MNIQYIFIYTSYMTGTPRHVSHTNIDYRVSGRDFENSSCSEILATFSFL